MAAASGFLLELPVRVVSESNCGNMLSRANGRQTFNVNLMMMVIELPRATSARRPGLGAVLFKFDQRTCTAA
jgi:hypothetical protein